jgi:hypothetical protein
VKTCGFFNVFALALAVVFFCTAFTSFRFPDKATGQFILELFSSDMLLPPMYKRSRNPCRSSYENPYLRRFSNLLLFRQPKRLKGHFLTR